MTRLARAAGAFALAFAWGMLVDRFVPIFGAVARIARAEQSAEDWRRNAQAWRAYGEGEARGFRQSEALRREEQARAVAAVSDAEARCRERLSTARASDLAIRHIVSKEPGRDPKGCPLRELVPAERLRDAIAPRGER
jgi:hypothetical protein